MGTVHVLEAVRRSAGRARRGDRHQRQVLRERRAAGGYREDDPLGGHDPYSNSKACAELVTARLSAQLLPRDGRSRASRCASARAGNVIGGGDWARDRLVPDAMRAFLERQPLRIRNPSSMRPWQHVLEPLLGYLMPGRAAGRTTRASPRAGTSVPSAETRAAGAESSSSSPRNVGRGRRLDSDDGAASARGRLSEARLLEGPRAARLAPRWTLGAGARSHGRLVPGVSARRGLRQTSLEQIELVPGWRRSQTAHRSRQPIISRRACRCQREVIHMISAPAPAHAGPTKPRKRSRVDHGTGRGIFRTWPMRRNRSCRGQSPVPVSGTVFDAERRQIAGRFGAGLLADDRPLQRAVPGRRSPSASASRYALTVNSGSSANLVAFSALTSPLLRRAAARAGRRGHHRGGRLPDHGQPDRAVRAGAGVRRRRHPDLQHRSPSWSRRRSRRRPARSWSRTRWAIRSTPSGIADDRQAARPVADRGLLRRARRDARRPPRRHLRRHRHAELLSRAPHHDGRGRRGLHQRSGAATRDGSVPRLGPRLLVRSGQGQHLRAAASTGSSANCRTATTTSTPTRISATT